MLRIPLAERYPGNTALQCSVVPLSVQYVGDRVHLALALFTLLMNYSRCDTRVIRMPACSLFL